MRPRASRASNKAMFSSTMPAPARMVSAACASGLSPSESAAAMPACAQTLEPPWPKGVTESTVTGSGASLSAANKPASPAPTMTTPPCDRRSTPSKADLSFVAMARVPSPYRLVAEIDHALDRHPRPRSDLLRNGHLLFQHDEGLKDLRQRDALHMRAKIARTHEIDLRRLMVMHPFDHAAGRAGEIGFGDHVGGAFGVGNDLDAGIGLAIGAELLAGEALMHLAMALPCDDIDGGLGGDPLRQILVRDHDDARDAKRLDHAHGIGRGAANVGLGLHLGRGVDVGDDRHAGIGLAQRPH